MKYVNFWSRLFNTESAKKAYIDNINNIVLDSLSSPAFSEMAYDIIKEAAARYNKDLAEAEAKLRIEEENKNLERIKQSLDSNVPWFEVKDINGDMMDVNNYRWNKAFIDKLKVESGYNNLTSTELFKKFLDDRSHRHRMEIIREEKDRRLNDPTPWFEWAIEGGVSDEGYPVHMEWNNAFINHLRGQGFTGRNEDEIVRLWLSRMIRYTPNDTKVSYE